jgi:hypothetical protein
MATQPPPTLPVLYKRLEPLSSSLHAKFRHRPMTSFPHLVNVNAVPLTIDEFIIAQRFMPIVFSSGEMPVPLGLMGLNEGVNVYVDDEGKLRVPFYVPAYARRYPYLLARLAPDAQELSLCADFDSGLVGPFDDGEALFDGDKPSEGLNNILKFCEEFEVAANRTEAFARELQALDVLIDGEVAIEPPGALQPFVYRGFKMVDEQKLRDLPGDKLRQISQNGILPLLVAHTFSLSLMRDVFAAQVELGRVPNYEANFPKAEAQA